MIDPLITLLVAIIVVGIVYYLLRLIINMIPMEENFKQIALVLLVLICVLIVLAKALPLIGVHVL
jgi:Kef-type K+ transport system membrane component KefB